MYEVLLNGTSVGFAQMERQGLYYKIQCICRFSDNLIHRIKVSDGRNEIILGVCIPEADHFALTKKIPVKNLKGETFCFAVLSTDENKIPVASGQPFGYLDKLDTARLQNTNGQPRIMIGQFRDQQGSGQNREYQNK